jgi:cellulose biosynthesis protein BcsQ
LAQNSNNAISTLQNLPGAINELIERVVDFNNIDIVFIDLNPGLSAINQNLFIISDAFIIPANPDPFSIMALKTLKEILPRWKKWARTARELFSEATYKIPQTENLFLGVIVQRFNIRNGKPAKPYQDNIGEIKRYAKNELEEVFDNHSMLFDNNFYNKNKINDDYCLLEISEFGALLQKAHKYNKPVYALTDEQLEVTGPVLEQMKSNRQKFDKQFYNLANIVIESIEYENG